MAKKNINIFFNSHQPSSSCLADKFKTIIFFIFTFYVLRFTFYVSPILAIDPIIIEEAIHEAPPAQGPPANQVNHESNDTAKNDLKCERVLKISNTFGPKETKSTDANGNPITTFKEYFVDTIKQLFTFKGQYSNTGINWLRRQTANRYTGTLSMTDPTIMKKAFTNFDATRGSASNASLRGLSAKTIACLKGKRMVAAAEYDSGVNDNSTVNNEAVACYKGTGTFQLLPDNSVKCNFGYVITLTDIMHFLATDRTWDPQGGFIKPDGTVDSNLCAKSPVPVKLFYPSDSACKADSQPFESYDYSTKAKYTLSGAEACFLFKHLVQPTDVGSNAQKVIVTNYDNIAKTETKETNDRSIPSGNTLTYDDLQSWILPANQKIDDVDVCPTVQTTNSPDRPNQFSILGFIKDAFGWVKETAQTFSGGVRLTTKIDGRIVKPMSKDNAFANTLLPLEQQQRFNTLNSSKSSSDNDRNIDPGDPLPRTVLNQNLLPAKFF